jgi:uncharacterized protein DUF4397
MTPRSAARRAATFRLASAAALAMLAMGLVAAVAPAAAAAPASAKARDGWIRLAHFSPNTPAVDVYLYSFGDPKAMIVLHHVAYGAVSPYEKVKVGQYTVAMRGAGAKASSPPVLSTTVQITPEGAYTVAGVGPAKGIKLQVIRDRLSTPPGKALVRVIQASLRHPRVTVTAAGQVLVHNLAFSHMTSYMAVKPGDWMVSVHGGGRHAGKTVPLTAGTIHTVVVLDGSHGKLQLTDLVDAAGSGMMPQGGADTGFGGTAPAPAPSPLPWIAVVAGGVLCFGAGAYGLRRRGAPRHVPR